MKIHSVDAEAHAAALYDIVSATNPDEEIQVLDGGETSTVLRVGDVLYKSPHTSVGDHSSVIRFEAAVAEPLPAAANLATGAVLAMPQLVASHPDKEPPYNMLRYVPGNIWDMPDIAMLSDAAKTQLGRDLGSFVAWLGKAIPVSKFDDIQASTPAGVPLTLIDALREFRLPHLRTILDNGYGNTAELLKELTGTLPPAYENPSLEPLTVGHGDLRAANMTFENERLKGIFDFGCLFLTDPAEELRFTCLVSEAALEAAIEQYYVETELWIPSQRIVHYAGAQAMLSASYCAINGVNAFSPSNRNFLDQYYPDKDWSELDDFSGASI